MVAEMEVTCEVGCWWVTMTTGTTTHLRPIWEIAGGKAGCGKRQTPRWLSKSTGLSVRTERGRNAWRSRNVGLSSEAVGLDVSPGSVMEKVLCSLTLWR